VIALRAVEDADRDALFDQRRPARGDEIEETMLRLE
jgi:hypothetical protein